MIQTFSDYYNIQREKERRPEKENSKTDSPTMTYGKYMYGKDGEELPVIYPIKSKACLVVIPMYQTVVTDFEYRNLQNTWQMLSPNYDICLLVPERLNVETLIENIGFKPMILREKSHFFRSKESYSLMLERAEFYERLLPWEYMLIVQPDVWLFHTTIYKLEYFLTLKQAYIGAPWKQEYAEKIGIPEDAVGNGGLSLRNTKMMVELLKTSVKRNYALKTVEDQFLTFMLYHSGQMCSPFIGMLFSIDNNPAYWHKQAVVFPMGAHLSKQEFKDYWKPFIEQDIKQSGFTYKRAPKIIVSMTSFGERLKKDAPIVIEHFLRTQTMKPERLVLTVYKDDEHLVPDKIRRNKKVKVIVWPENLRPHLKYYPVMQQYPDDIIITIDDDQYYDKTLIEDLYNTYKKHPKYVAAARCHQITFHADGRVRKYNEWRQECLTTGQPSMLYFATGVGGVLYPPHIFQDKFSMERIKEFITTDDIYLKDLEMELDIPVVPSYKDRPVKLRYINTKSAVGNRLCDDNTKGLLINDKNIQKCNWTKWTCNNSTKDTNTTMNNDDTTLISGKRIVYTVISGNYDTLKEPRTVTPGWTYICFTDQKIQSNAWTILPIPEQIINDRTLNQVRRQRMMKICPHLLFRDYEVVVWVDANLIIKKNLDDLVREYPDALCVPKHPDRDCIYEESKAIVKYSKDKPANLRPQEDFYRQEGFPQHFGLNETNVIIRRPSEQVKQIMELWAEMVRKYSHRDQMSFNYVLWKLHGSVTNISQEKRKEYFDLRPHQKIR